jgi:hypothetical protein
MRRSASVRGRRDEGRGARRTIAVVVGELLGEKEVWTLEAERTVGEAVIWIA